MTLEQAIIVEKNKAKEWRGYGLPDSGDNIHEEYAEWFEELQCQREAWSKIIAEIKDNIKDHFDDIAASQHVNSGYLGALCIIKKYLPKF